MNFVMKFGDTNFIGVANTEEYKSFVSEDWDVDDLLFKHIAEEMRNGHILFFQMTAEGIEHSWNVEVLIDSEEEKIEQSCFRKASGFIKVTHEQLFLVDYDCITMAAQFENHKVPDQNCSQYRIEIPNGDYQVEVFQYYNVDDDEYTGTNQKDILLHFRKADQFQDIADKTFWYTY
nr:hypothetical protein [Cytobacillus gottheilii]